MGLQGIRLEKFALRPLVPVGAVRLPGPGEVILGPEDKIAAELAYEIALAGDIAALCVWRNGRGVALTRFRECSPWQRLFDNGREWVG
jgi:hypothetical protein